MLNQFANRLRRSKRKCDSQFLGSLNGLPLGFEQLEQRNLLAEIAWKLTVASGFWDEGANWVGGVAPGKDDVAVFNDNSQLLLSGGAAAVNLRQGQSVVGVSVEGGRYIIGLQGHTLTIDDSLTVNAKGAPQVERLQVLEMNKSRDVIDNVGRGRLPGAWLAATRKTDLANVADSFLIESRAGIGPELYGSAQGDNSIDHRLFLLLAVALRFGIEDSKGAEGGERKDEPRAKAKRVPPMRRALPGCLR